MSRNPLKRARTPRVVAPRGISSRVVGLVPASWRERAGHALAPVTERVGVHAGRLSRSISTLGWSVAVAAVIGWVAAIELGWVEAVYLAAAATLLLIVCALLTIGRTLVQVVVELRPERVTVGDPAAGQVSVTNTSRAPLLPVTLELPIGTQTARFELPTLGPGAEHDEVFIVPTSRRGVIPVGPATTVRGDPFGLFGRSVAWTGVTQLYVHPLTVPLDSVGTGLLRDLEGQATTEMSMSDLAFHTLRDYVPGDDRRFIHWRSSAKVGGGQPGGRFLVRQFLDSRRSHISIVVDSRLASYHDEDAFETAISAAASLAVRATQDNIDLTVVVGQQITRDPLVHMVLDAFALAEPDQTELGAAAVECARAAPDTSLVIVVTGAHPAVSELQLATAQFQPEVVRLVIRVDPTTVRSGAAIGLITLRQIAELDDLPVVLRGVSV